MVNVVWTVDEVHCVRDAVEGQSFCTVIHIHSYSPAAGENSEFTGASQ